MARGRWAEEPNPHLGDDCGLATSSLQLFSYAPGPGISCLSTSCLLGVMLCLGPTEPTQVGKECAPGPGNFSRKLLCLAPDLLGVQEKDGPHLPRIDGAAYAPGPGCRDLLGSVRVAAPKLNFGMREHLAKASVE